MKITRSGEMPNDCNAGGKIVREVLIHISAPRLRITEESMPAIKPDVAALSSEVFEINS